MLQHLWYVITKLHCHLQAWCTYYSASDFSCKHGCFFQNTVERFFPFFVGLLSSERSLSLDDA